MVRIGIIGAAGLSGRELLYLLESHDEASVELLTSSKLSREESQRCFSGVDRIQSQVFSAERY